MKSSNRFVLLASVVAALGTLSSSAFAATADGTASATVLAPITITNGTNLNFGSFANNAAGTVTISTAGARSASGVVLTSGVAGVGGTFTVAGTGAATFSITSPQGFSVTGPGTAMAFTLTLPGATGTLSGGAATINVGGVLTVAADQAAGAYTGTYSVAVEYN